MIFMVTLIHDTVGLFKKVTRIFISLCLLNLHIPQTLVGLAMLAQMGERFHHNKEKLCKFSRV